MGWTMRVGGVLAWAAVSLLASLGACGDSDPDDSGDKTAGQGGGASGGAAGQGAAASGGAGGTGATGGSGGAAGPGGSGGGPECTAADTTPPPAHPCLDEGAYADFFALIDRSVCVTAVYESDVEVGYAAVPTWGKHGGPLLVYPGDGDSVDLVRLTPPAGQTGMVSSTTTNVAAMIPGNAYLGAQAVDLPFFEQTALSWTGPGFPPGSGQVVLAHGADVVGYDALPFAMGAVGDPCQPGRLLYTGLSLLGSVATAPDEPNALFAADSCGTGAAPHFGVAPASGGAGGGGGAGGAGDCEPPIEVHGWGNASGPLAADSAGNVIVVMNHFVDGNLARGFAAAEIARGAPPTAGTALFTIPGYGNSVAAIAPTVSDAGMVVFQAVEGTAGANPVVQRYQVNGGKVVAEAGAPSELLDLSFDGAIALAFNDRHDRVWIAISNPINKAAFFVLERVP
jgi:hypothetical protein